MQHAVSDDLESESLKKEEESGSETRESDNAWRLKSVSEEELKKWEAEKERYDEVLEYIREVDEILDLIRPFPRDKAAEGQRQDLVRSDSSQSTRYGLDHLENIVKIVEQLKELQENNSKLSERTCYLKDLKKLREHKRRLKNEELELKSRTRSRSTASPEVFQEDFPESQSKARKISSTASEKLECESEGWQHKRKSLCLPHVEGQNKSKVSKWTKVKEAFHWERTSMVSKASKKEPYPGDEEKADYPRDHSPDDSFLLALDGFSPPLPPPPPPPPPPLAPVRLASLPLRPEDLLSVRPLQDFPSSSSSDRLEEFYAEALAKGNKTPDADSSSQVFTIDDNEDVEGAVRKSSSGEFPQHLSKEELTTRSPKTNKTTWGKVKDIIQTRKDSLKKKPKKRGSDEFKKRRKLSSLSTSQLSDPFDDLSSPEDKLKSLGESIPKSGYDFPEDPAAAAPLNVECSKKLMPALTVTLPSTEELRSFSCEELEKNETGKSGQNQRLSRWIKVKRVFLTSGASSRPPNYSPVNDSSPTSQNKSSGFFSDMESDDVSSGEWIDDKSPSQEKSKLGELEAQSAAGIQEDIRKSYNELQKKLSHEFDQKLREWGEMRSEGSGKPEDSYPRPKGEDGGDSIPKFRKTRDSMAVPLPNLNDLSPEFKKKLNDWKKMKTSQSSSSVSSSATKEEVQGGQNIKIRIGEWQPWRSRCSQKASAKPELVEEAKSVGSRPPSNSRKEKDGVEGSTLRRNSKKRDSLKKMSHSRTSSGADSIVSSSSTDKDGKFRRTPKVKDFQWVEKELQKIEREKLRLEQEREKYLEREARLEKMKKTMGTTCPTQEVLVRTPAGFFRFKGISQKFTKKLYEWEKARGIAPEASTFALLEESAKTSINGDSECEAGVSIQRSKSTGSVPELSSTLLIQTMAHHPSSLSLNDVDDLKTREEADGMDESISSERIKAESEEPEAIIVDVEDIEEETAMLADPPACQGEIPVYTYASKENHLLVDSSERFYFADDGVKIIQEAGSSGRQLFEKFQESEFKFRKTTNEVYEGTSEEKELVDDSTRDVLLVRNTFEDSKEVSRTTFDDVGTTLDRKQQLHLLTNEEFQVTKPNEPVEPEPAAPPILTKSPKTFFDWTSSSEMSYARDSSEVSEDFKPSPSVGRSETKINVDPGRTKNDPEALKRKIKEKITLMQRMSTEGKTHSWRHSEHSYSRTSREESGFRLENDKKGKEEGGMDVVFSPQPKKEKTSEEKTVESGSFPSVNVFVPTTRKIISPVQTTKGMAPVFSYVIDDVKSEEPEGKPETGHSKQSSTLERTPPRLKTATQLGPNDNPSAKSNIERKRGGEIEGELEKKRDIGIPPLPNSPKSFKKLNPKETAPSIRMIIAKYNQKISEHDNGSEKRTESGSPTIWRSPVFGRRTQEKIDQYKRNGEVQKSASLDNMRSIPTVSSLTPPRDQEPRIKGILKSSSVGVMKIRSQNSEGGNETPGVSSGADTPKENSPSVLRALKIQKAKEDFLSGRLGGSSDASTPVGTPKTSEPPEIPTLGKPHPQIEVRVEDTEQNLTKSVSAETITSEKGDGAGGGKSSEARPLQKSSSKFDISSIKSKFRKIRMRKEKDPKLNAVAVLCRQSLFIEVPKSPDADQPSTSMSKSCPSSPVMDRNKPEKPHESGDKKSKNR